MARVWRAWWRAGNAEPLPERKLCPTKLRRDSHLRQATCRTPRAVRARQTPMDAETLAAKDRQRRAHTKSRNGCLQCRKQHIKCDEAHPVCGYCRKRLRPCTLAFSSIGPPARACQPRYLLPQVPAGQLAWTTKPPRLSTASSKPHAEPVPFARLRSPAPPDLHRLATADLELLHATFNDSAFLGSLTADSVQLGQAFPFILHLVFSLAALRLFDKQPHRSELLVRADRHQILALRLVRPQLAALDRGNVDAVLRFTYLVSIAALGHPLYGHSKVGTPHTTDAIGDMIRSFHITRGMRFTSQRKWELHEEPFSDDTPNMEDEDPWMQGLHVKYPHYSGIRDDIKRCCSVVLERSVCLDAIRKVFSFIEIIERWPELHYDARLIQIWPIELHPQFLFMLSNRHPAALFVLGNYAALLKLRSGDIWPFAPWPNLLLEAVEKSLGHRWQASLKWARCIVSGFSTEQTISS